MDKEIILKSTCDDSHFMSSEIILKLKLNDGLGGVSMNFNLQRDLPVYIRKEEIDDLINNLQQLKDLIK